jgi:hypothetical protein
MALLGKKSYLGDITNNVTGSSSLISRNSRLDLANPNPTKYYQTVGPDISGRNRAASPASSVRTRRPPGANAGSFGSDSQGTVTGGATSLDPETYIGYITSEIDDFIITEDNNKIITE